MFKEKEIVLAFIKDIRPPKKKFLITLYRDNELNLLACFTTSQHRIPILPEKLHHGVIKQDNDPIGYVFDRNIPIGTNPETGNCFSFNKRTLIPFDYSIQEGTLEKFMNRVEEPQIVCILNDKEFEKLLYAMYRSPNTPQKYIPILEKALQDYYSKMK